MKKLDEQEVKALNFIMTHEGFRVILDILKKYEEFYLEGLLQESKKEVADLYRGNIQVLRNFEEMLQKEIKKSKKEIQEKVVQI